MAYNLHRKSLIVAIMIVMIGLFYLLTIREGHKWGDDFAMYIRHAKNIVEGIDYRETGYIYNPFHPYVGPKTYPPLFPLLLAPIYNWFGINLTVMKVEVILFFIASLPVIFLAFKDDLPFHYLVSAIAIIGFNPYFWSFKDNIFPDMPLLFFIYASLLLIHRGYQYEGLKRLHFIYELIVGFFMYFSYGTKSIGIVLIPSLLIYDVIKSRRITQFSVNVILLFATLTTLQTMFFHSDSDYLDIFSVDHKFIFRNLFSYANKFIYILWDNSNYVVMLIISLSVTVCILTTSGYMERIISIRKINFLQQQLTASSVFICLIAMITLILPLYFNPISIFTLWDNGHNKIFCGVLSMVMCVLAARGYLARAREEITIYEIFLILYIMLLIILHRIEEVRYIIPIIPLYIFYAFLGIRSIYASYKMQIKRSVFFVLLSAIFSSYVSKYMTVNFGPIAEGIAKKETQELFGYIRSNTKKDDVFIFRNPRALSLFTDRSASTYHYSESNSHLWDYFKSIGVTYIIVRYSDEEFFQFFIEQHKEDFEEVYTNSDFKLYKVKDSLLRNNRSQLGWGAPRSVNGSGQARQPRSWLQLSAI